jgi:hypothetical protein
VLSVVLLANSQDVLITPVQDIPAALDLNFKEFSNLTWTQRTVNLA